MRPGIVPRHLQRRLKTCSFVNSKETTLSSACISRKTQALWCSLKWSRGVSRAQNALDFPSTRQLFFGGLISFHAERYLVRLRLHSSVYRHAFTSSEWVCKIG